MHSNPSPVSPPTRQTFINGKVFTGRGEDDFVTAFVVEGGRIAWVGDALAAAPAYAPVDAPGDEQVIDLGGRTVLPGFIDVHTHPSWMAAILGAVPCTVPLVHDIPGMIEALRRHPSFGKGGEVWIEGFGYDESKLAERRTPTAADLDRVSTTQPVHVMRSDCHSGVCNTRALELAGITRDTPDPDGGRFGRTASGDPNGVLQEHAANDAVLRMKGAPDHETRVRGIAGLGAHYAERGIVAVTDMLAMSRPFDDLDVYREAARRGLMQQAALYFSWSELKAASAPDLTDARRGGRIRFAGVKLFADGSVSGRTAWMSEAYRDSDEHGYPTLTDEEMHGAYEWARRNGVQVAVHAMGDRAIQRVIEFFADREPWMGPDIPSVRIEHVTFISREQQRRMREGRMVFGASTQVIFFFAEHDSYVASLTDAQYRRAYPIRDAYHGIERFGLSSDAPATTWSDPDDVFVSIKAAVTRRAYNGADIGQAQAITVPQAVLLYTARAASVAPFDGSLGRIAPGFEASFIVLDRDVFTVPVDEIDLTVVEETWIRGERVYARDRVGAQSP